MRVPCPQCGAAVEVREAAGFPACPYCRVRLVLDLSGVRPHFLYRPRVLRAEVLPLLRRWADEQRVASPAPVSPPRLTYYPFWRYRAAGATRLTPAWPTLGAHWDTLAPPDAEQTLFDDPAQTGEASVVEATVPEASARRRLGLPADAAAGDLVHLPFFEIDARLGARQETLILDACSARIYSENRIGPAGAAEPPRHRIEALIAAAALLAALLLPTHLAAPGVVAFAGWLWARLAREVRPR